MGKSVELPLSEPLYSTYHYQGPSTAIIVNNPTIRNWYLNQTMDLTCNRKFQEGFTSPEITIPNTFWWGNPYFEKYEVSSRFAKGHINSIIREMIDNGYYVAFSDVDDYYVKGKSWYKERHFGHDGLICGYNQNNKTYCIYAYDSKWQYQKFWTPQRSFNAGRISMDKQGEFANFCALKAKDDFVEFSPKMVYVKLKEYLDSNLEKYPFEGDTNVYGIVVHEFIAEYVTKLYRSEIPYERMDRRVFRLIWEHKKAMLERIELVEKILGLDSEISQKYKKLVAQADTMRVLYATHHMKRRDSVLPIIKNILLNVMGEEGVLLSLLLKKMELDFGNESMDFSDSNKY